MKVANQVVQALLTQKDLKEECVKLRTRVFDLEQQNRILSVLFQQRVKMSTNTNPQDLSGRPGSTKDLSARPGSTQDLSGRPGSTQDLSGRPGSTQDLSGRPGSTQDLSARPGSTQDLAGRPGSTQDLSARPGSTQDLSGQNPRVSASLVPVFGCCRRWEELNTYHL
ncbi:unnamed protein product [Boreogadus saida]